MAWNYAQLLTVPTTHDVPFLYATSSSQDVHETIEFDTVVFTQFSGISKQSKVIGS